MDDPGLEEARHLRALSALATVNMLSGTAGRVWRAIRSLPAPRGRPLRVLDVACGGGDVAVSLARHAARRGFPLEVHGCDRSPVALAHAGALAARRGAAVTFLEHDALAGPLPGGYDLACSSLFLHHLPDDAASDLLGAMARAAEAVLVQDLRRTRLGWALAALVLNTVARSDVARVDGLRSVEAAYTLEEAEALARRAGLTRAVVRPCWPQRFLLSWRRG